MQEILTVTALTERIRDTLEGDFDLLWVKGEVSNLRHPASGHVYFTLKDERSQIRAVLFRAMPYARATARFALEEGMHVVCRARLSVYAPRGEYQLVVETVEPKGLGALQKAFEQLKERLHREGLFAAAHKKSLPFLPRRIGLVTSPSGAVLRDILQITARRLPCADILIAPVRVQGSEAPREIVGAMQNLHAAGGVDVIILARGGGSLEDLAPFNDEAVARAIFASRIPVVSAVGHETDVTIADFVADLRAPTPSAAAELVAPSRRDLLETLASLEARLAGALDRRFGRERERIFHLRERFRDPRRRLAELRLALDDQGERLKGLLAYRVVLQRHLLARLALRLRQGSPETPLHTHRQTLMARRTCLKILMQGKMEALRNAVHARAALLDSLGPMEVLRRGYGIVFLLPERRVVTDASVLSPGDAVDVVLRRGSFEASVTGVGGEGGGRDCEKWGACDGERPV